MPNLEAVERCAFDGELRLVQLHLTHNPKLRDVNPRSLPGVWDQLHQLLGLR